ncbi:MAG TPA: MFS transporter, partial [Tardiphaga sp.]
VWAVLGVFWSLPTLFLTGPAAAGGLAAINGFAQIGGFAGPYLVGWIKDTTQSFTPALLTLAAGPIIAAILCLAVKVKKVPAAQR